MRDSRRPPSTELHLQSCRSETRRDAPSEDIPSKLFLRVLEGFDSEFNAYVARCLETGTIATAEVIEEAHNLLMETLRLEVVQASRAGQPFALFAKPAAPQFQLRWQELASRQEPTAQTVTVLDVPIGTRKGVKSELAIFAVKQDSVA